MKLIMNDPCYYCLCNSCVNNAESITVLQEEVSDQYKPCFFCDICSAFDDNNFENMERESCSDYKIDNYHAIKKRNTFRLI